MKYLLIEYLSNCCNDVTIILVSLEGFHKAWMYYHDRQLSILKAHENDKGLSPMEYIIWTSGLTAQPYIDRLSPQNYTIQIWTDPTVSNQA